MNWRRRRQCFSQTNCSEVFGGLLGPCMALHCRTLLGFEWEGAVVRPDKGRVLVDYQDYH